MLSHVQVKRFTVRAAAAFRTTFALCRRQLLLNFPALALTSITPKRTRIDFLAHAPKAAGGLVVAGFGSGGLGNVESSRQAPHPTERQTVAASTPCTAVAVAAAFDNRKHDEGVEAAAAAESRSQRFDHGLAGQLVGFAQRHLEW